MVLRIEHANLIVRNIDESIRFLMAAFPEFAVRRDQTEPDGGRWAHIGTAETYIALNQASREPAERWTPYAGLPGVNHIAFEVDDVEDLRQRLLAAGFEESTIPNTHPARRRVYFLDADGNDWEFVQYLTDDPGLRHDYDLADR